MMARDDPHAAALEYEAALSIIKYLTNTDPKWRDKGLRDDDILEVSLLKKWGIRQDDKAAASEVMAQCYTNLAMAYYKQGEMKVM